MDYFTLLFCNNFLHVYGVVLMFMLCVIGELVA